MMISWLFVLAMAFKFFGRIWGKSFRHKRYQMGFEDLPFDVTIQILKYLGAKQSAKMCLVNKRLNSIASENHLWMYFLQQEEPCVFFAESHLRILRTLPSAPSLPLMTIYGQRAQVPRAVIVDGGLGYARFGWSKDSAPSRTSATSLVFRDTEHLQNSLDVSGYFLTIYTRMQAKRSRQPIIVSMPIFHHDGFEYEKAAKRHEEAIVSTLLDMDVPAVCVVNEAVLALFAARELSGIVVHIGIHQTSIVPVRHGEIMHQVGVKATEIGALKVMEFLTKQLEDHNIYVGRYFTDNALRQEAMGSSTSRNFLHSCKMLCYVALDYEAELSSEDSNVSVGPFGGIWITLSVERFRTGEVLFQPQLAGMNAMSLQDSVVLCMKKCQEANVAGDDSWYRTVVLAGGCACMPGLAGRLEKEVLGLLPPPMTRGIRVLPPPYGADSAWFGAQLIGNLSNFPTSWCRQRS